MAKEKFDFTDEENKMLSFLEKTKNSLHCTILCAIMVKQS